MTPRIQRRILHKRVLFTLATATSVVAFSLAGAPAASAAARVAYDGAIPSWAVHANDQGPAPADTSVEGEIYLPLRHASAAASLARVASTPGFGYRLTLSPERWISTFSPTPSSLDSLVSYLKGQGLTITAVPASRQYVVFRGTAAQLNSGFATSLHTYSYAGKQLVAPASAPSVPSAIAGSVAGVSLDQGRFLTRPDSIQQGDLGASQGPQLPERLAVPPAPVKTQCSTYAGEHTVTVPAAYNGQTEYGTYNCGYTPSQIRSAYGLDSLAASGIDGSGQTVAIIDAYASPSIVNDVNTYSANLGEPALTDATYQQIVPDSQDFSDEAACQFPSGWQSEQTLDVEAVHATAPGAKILYVGGFNCGGGLDIAMSKVLDNKLANIVSNSYGDVGEALPADAIKGETNLQLQAAGEGIGLYFSSGDSGDEAASLGSPAPDFPASSPWVTAVGGTSLGINQQGGIAYETGWGDTADQIVADPSGSLSYVAPVPGTLFVGGAGGGTSGVFDQPWYQRGIVPSALANGHRVSPDIAALADPYTGFLIGLRPIIDDSTLQVGDFVNETYGGTSLASPLTAAQIALVQQLTGTTIGFANPTLYSIYRFAPSAFRDVVPNNPPQAVAYTSKASQHSFLISFDTDTSLKTQPRYDDVTGLGGVSFSLLTMLAHGRP